MCVATSQDVGAHDREIASRVSENNRTRFLISTVVILSDVISVAPKSDCFIA
jgi:hypothetical protein